MRHDRHVLPNLSPCLLLGGSGCYAGLTCRRDVESVVMCDYKGCGYLVPIRMENPVARIRSPLVEI